MIPVALTVGMMAGLLALAKSYRQDMPSENEE
jgi:hypothetical protein